MGLEQPIIHRPRRKSLVRGAALFAAAGGVAFFVATRRPSVAAPGPPDVPEQAWAPTPEAPKTPEPTKTPEPARTPEAPPAPEPAKTAASKARIPGGALSAQLTLGQAKLVRGSDGELYLHVGVDAVDDAGKRERRPIDFALVLDVSGSMEEEGKIDLLKRATKDLLAKLGPEDRVTVIAFSNDARTVFPLASLGDPGKRKAYEEAVAALEPGGGTNLSAGLLAGADELRHADERPGSARRIVLMTDGLANFGVQEAPELCKLVNGLAREGFTCSTIGLGLEYGEKLLTDMADAGGGNFHDADKADKMARIYDAELEATRALVARNTRLVISPAPGVSVESVLLWPVAEGERGERTISLGDVSGGRHLKTVVRLKVPTGAEASALDVVKVALRYDDVRGKKAESVATETVALGVEVVKDEQVAMASHAKEIESEVKDASCAYALQQAHDFALAGKTKEARDMVDRCRRINGGNVLVATVDGTRQAVDLDRVAAVCSSVADQGALDDAGNRLMKECQAVGTRMAK